MSTLQDRDVIRSANNPVETFCEGLVAKHFGVAVETQSTKGYDVLADGVRYQVKGGDHPRSRPSHYSPIRNIAAARVPNLCSPCIWTRTSRSPTLGRSPMTRSSAWRAQPARQRSTPEPNPRSAQPRGWSRKGRALPTWLTSPHADEGSVERGRRGTVSACRACSLGIAAAASCSMCCSLRAKGRSTDARLV